jgi:hypothetical protein
LWITLTHFIVTFSQTSSRTEVRTCLRYAEAEESMKTMYVQNMSPHHIMKNMTLEEDFTRVKHEVGQFRIFGCPVYIHVPKEKRTKLDPSRIKGTFLGYNEYSKEYWIYILGQRQIEVIIYVTFEEEIAFQRSI